jgi:hypothetical protein
VKSKLLFCALCAAFLLLGGVLSAQEGEGEAPTGVSPDQFYEVLSLDWTLQQLAASVIEGKVEQIPKQRYLLIEGIVSSRQLIQAEEANYFAILELSSGEWGDEQDLEMYRCYFRLEGPEFYGMVPEGRRGGPQEIPLHAHVLAIGTYLGYGEDNQGNRFPVLRALEVRVLRQ